MRLRKTVPFVLALALGTPAMAIPPVEANSLDAYVLAVRAAGDDPSKLGGTRAVQFGGESVLLETGWTRFGASQASRETLKALESRVDVARLARPTAFSPQEIRRRLSNLLDRLYPSRVRAMGAAADEPVKVDAQYWTHGTVHAGHVAGSGCCGVAHTYGGTASGGSGGYSGGGSTVVSTTRRTHHTRRSTTTRSTSTATQVSVNQGSSSVTNPAKTYEVRHTPPPQRVEQRQTTQPALATVSRPTEVALTPPPKPPAVTPPPPPPTTITQVEKKGVSWITVILAVLLAALPVAAYMYWRSRRQPAPPPPVAPPKSVADLVDPEHVGLGSVALGQIGRKSAEEEDWMRAMRYLFAALLTFLAEQRRVPIRDFHTNREIAGLVGADAKLAENFWSAATIFELFWFGQKRPMENDFRMFEMMARECMTRLEVRA